MTLHMMSILMQSVMIEAVFYGVPHHKGFFEEETNEEGEDNEKPTAINQDDDGFNKVE